MQSGGLCGSGQVFYAGTVCSLLKDDDTGENIFFYNKCFKPTTLWPAAGMSVFFSAFHDHKVLKYNRPC